jgi:hypothetical protein
MSWSNWKSEDIGIKVKGAPAVSSWKEGRLDVFVRGTDDKKIYENDQWGTKWKTCRTDKIESRRRSILGSKPH